MLEIGAGQDVAGEVRAAVEAAAKLFERNGATLVPVAPMLTRAMLDGLDHFWRARDPGRTSRPLPAERRAQGFFPTSVNGPRRAQKCPGSRRCVVSARRWKCARLRRNCSRRSMSCCRRPRRSPAFPAELRLAAQRSRTSVRTYRLHRGLEHVGAAGGFDQLRLYRRRDCRSGCRSSAAGSTIPVCCASPTHSKRGVDRRNLGRRLSPATAGAPIATDQGFCVPRSR